MSEVHKNVVRVIEAGRVLGLVVEPKRFPEGAKTAVDAANAIGCEVAQIVKSLVFGVDGEIVLAYVSGSNQLDERKLAAAAGGLMCSARRCRCRPRGHWLPDRWSPADRSYHSVAGVHRPGSAPARGRVGGGRHLARRLPVGTGRSAARERWGRRGDQASQAVSIVTWHPELEELRRREALAEQLGGADKVERQHHFGKQTVRERVTQIVDEGSFWELGKTAGVASYDDQGNLIEFTPSNFVFGIAELDGRPAVVSGDDFTVRGGSNDASISAKREASESIALEMRLPHVRLLDGMSGGGSVKTIEQAGRTYIPVLPGWHTVVDHLNVAPSVSLVLGSVAGFGAARAVASHYSVMVRGTSQMMIAGPALVEQAGLGAVAKEDLGHADIHTANGAIDDAVDSEAEAFDRALHFLSYLPTSIDELPPVEHWGDEPGAARRVAVECRAAQPAPVVRHEGDHRLGRRRGHAVRDR